MFEDIAKTPRYKVERAKHHLSDLSIKVQAYFERSPFRLVLMRPVGGDRAQPFFKSEIPIPPEFSLIIGDAVHNLRSALDHTIWQLVGSLASNPRRVQYPFPAEAVSQEGFRSLILKRELRIAGEGVIRAIIDLNGQPGGDEFLYAVHTLDIVDKHRLIVTTCETVSYDRSNMTSVLPGVSTNWMFPAWVRVKPGERIGGFVADWIEEVAENQPIFFLSFEDQPAFGQHNVIAVLQKMAERVKEAVDLLISTYLADQ